MKHVTTITKCASSVTHWPAGPLKGLTYSNGTTLSQTFNLRYEPLIITSGPVSLTLTPAKARDPDPEQCETPREDRLQGKTVSE